MKIHRQRSHIYSFTYVFLPQHLEAIVVALGEWAEVQTPKQFAAMAWALGPNGSPCIILLGSLDGSKEDGELAFKRFFDIGPVHVTHGEIAYEVQGTLADAVGAMKGNKVINGAKFTQLDYPTVKKAYDAWIEITKKAPLSTVAYEFYHLDIVAAVPIEATAYPDRHPHRDIGLQLAWTGVALSVSEARDMLLNLKAIISSSSIQDAQDSLGYANYADCYSTMNETDEYAKKLFGPNYPKLQEIKKKYDPDMIWNTWFAIRPSV